MRPLVFRVAKSLTASATFKQGKVDMLETHVEHKTDNSVCCLENPNIDLASGSDEYLFLRTIRRDTPDGPLTIPVVTAFFCVTLADNFDVPAFLQQVPESVFADHIRRRFYERSLHRSLPFRRGINLRAEPFGMRD